jgi:hypothetical protein
MNPATPDSANLHRTGPPVSLHRTGSLAIGIRPVRPQARIGPDRLARHLHQTGPPQARTELPHPLPEQAGQARRGIATRHDQLASYRATAIRRTTVTGTGTGTGTACLSDTP